MTNKKRFCTKALPTRLALRMGERTFPKYRPLLNKVDHIPSLIALGLLDGEELVGLALGKVSNATAVLLSISITETRRRQGGGGVLLADFESMAMRLGATAFHMRFTRNRDTAPPIQLLAESAGWSAPELFSTIYTLDSEMSLRAPWFTRAQGRLDPSRIQAWSTLGDDPLAMIGAAECAPDELHPRHHAPTGIDGAPLDTEASAVLRAAPEPNAEIIGWIMAHRTGPQSSRISAGWVRPDHIRGFPYGALIAHANRTLFERGDRRASFVVRPYETRMALFAERRIAPMIETVRESVDCRKPAPRPGG